MAWIKMMEPEEANGEMKIEYDKAVGRTGLSKSRRYERDNENVESKFLL
jgi:hypothetical protein